MAKHSRGVKKSNHCEKSRAKAVCTYFLSPAIFTKFLYSESLQAALSGFFKGIEHKISFTSCRSLLSPDLHTDCVTGPPPFVRDRAMGFEARRMSFTYNITAQLDSGGSDYWVWLCSDHGASARYAVVVLSTLYTLILISCHSTSKIPYRPACSTTNIQ